MRLSLLIIRRLRAGDLDADLATRPLKRTIQHLVVRPRSLALLEGKLAGQKEITLELAGDEIVFAQHTAAAGR